MPALAKKETTHDLSYLTRQLRSHTTKHTESQYEIGRLCSAIRANRLWEGPYSSFGAYVDGNLEFSPPTANKYATLFDDLQYHKFNKEKSLELIAEFPLTGLCRVLHEWEDQPSKKEIRAAIKKDGYQSNASQLNLTFGTKRNAERLDKLLVQHGMEIEKTKSRNGQSRVVRKGAREAIVKLMNDYEALQKRVKR